MKLTKDSYTLPRKLVEDILQVLSDNWFSYGAGDDDECYNNEDIIDLDKALQKELISQGAE